MLAYLNARIRTLPWWGQVIAWPLYGLTRLLGSLLGELFSQAKRGTKKIFAPLIWPAIGIGAVGLLVMLVGPGGIELLIAQLIGPIIGIAVMIIGLRYMVMGGKKKKKK